MEDTVRIDFGQIGRQRDELSVPTAALIPPFHFTDKVLFVTKKKKQKQRKFSLPFPLSIPR